ncbi:LuxR C-terminal-related transcriptional regulator [Desulfococcaceae bacterium OttesenSCG-928-F15]|nr:LuxR C-terminal-related transcriptional regulator [Desulfococcaceae bacterium OttesenSCG-928-F15]
MKLGKTNWRIESVAIFSLLFAYVLSFAFEGQVLYSLLKGSGLKADSYIMAGIVATCIGLFSSGFFIKTLRMAKYFMAGGMLVCLAATLPFFFAPSPLWLAALVVTGLAASFSIAAWGYFLKVFTPRDERIHSCADVLIASNIIMILINVVAINLSHLVGLILSTSCLFIATLIVWRLPVDETPPPAVSSESNPPGDLKKPMILLFLFVSVVTINSGLMYQVINPAFEHLTGLVSWYWAVPYIIALFVMRNLPASANRSMILYLGMTMIMGAFISFMLMGRGASDYLVINTLMLGACGIFDLFWWSILGGMLDYAKNPVKVFGIGLSANVFGVLCGGMLGMGVRSIALPDAQIAVIALTVVCLTLVLLPPLNRQLVILLKNHVYLTAYSSMSEKQQSSIIQHSEILVPLTQREKDVLLQILTGKSNKAIAEELFVSENTVKSHLKNIFSKYDVNSRSELISFILKNRIP